jgi:TolB protein
MTHPRRGRLAAALVLTSGLLSVGLTSTAGARAVPAPLAGDGRIAFSTGFIQPFPDLSGHSQVYTVNPDGNDLQKLTHVPEGSQAGDPDWSPDGSHIAYVSNESGSFALMTMNADGTGQQQVAQAGDTDYYTPRWSPDGTRLATSRCRSLNGYLLGCDIVVMDADGTDQRMLVGGHVVNQYPAWSPDGAQIAFTSDRSGLISAVWVVDSTGGGLRRLTGVNLEAFYPQWSPHGNRILFGNNFDRPLTNTYAVNPHSGGIRQVTHVPRPYSAFFATYSPDGKHGVLISDSLPGPGLDLFTMNADGTDLTPIVTNHPRVTYSDWGPSSAAIGAASTATATR